LRRLRPECGLKMKRVFIGAVGETGIKRKDAKTRSG
jgi:hypothetical protein